MAGAVLLDGLDDSLCNSVGVAGGRVVEADEVVVAGDVDRGVDAETNGREALFVVCVVFLGRQDIQHAVGDGGAAHDEGFTHLPP